MYGASTCQRIGGRRLHETVLAELRRRRPRPRTFAEDAGLRAVVAAKLGKHWSPAQISRWLRRRYRRRSSWHVCAETIYDSLYRGLIVPAKPRNLRTGRTYRHHRGRGRSRDGALKQSTNIRLTMLVRLPADHSAQSVGDALISVFGALPPALRRTLTWDQGNEMFHHERIEQATGLKIYFADPHSPWQRGSNENTNGLLRQYFPKGTDLQIWTAEQLSQIAAELNDRPWLCLNDKTPRQLNATMGPPAGNTMIRDDG